MFIVTDLVSLSSLYCKQYGPRSDCLVKPSVLSDGISERIFKKKKFRKKKLSDNKDHEKLLSMPKNLLCYVYDLSNCQIDK